jgi:dipeptidyl aminopeptidase/acylaminoacyl peptidase
MKKLIILALIAASFSAIAQDLLTPEALWKFKRLSDVQISPDKKVLIFGVSVANLERNNSQNMLYTMPANGSAEARQLIEYGASIYNARFRPDGKKIGFLSFAISNGDIQFDLGLQLFEINPDGTGIKQISMIPGGINGFEYSPDGSQIAFIRDVKLDPTPQEIYPDLPKTNVVIANDLMYRHWNAWHDYAYSHVFVASYNPESGLGRFRDIMEGERFDSPLTPDGGIEQIGWSPDGKRIAYTSRKKNGKAEAISTDSEIYVYDLTTGKTVNISHPGFDGYDQDPVFSPDGNLIVWRSMEEDGFESDKDRIILYDFRNSSHTDLSSGFDQSSSQFAFSPDSREIYFISGIHATYQVYKVRIDTRKITQISKGDHNYQSLLLAGDRIIGSKMSMSLPTEIFSLTFDGKETQLSKLNNELLKSLKLGKIEKRWIGTSDGKQMLTWVIYPPDFDPNKKYPALLYCQGGPQSAVSQFFSYRWNFQIMAAHGYIVVAPNRRGLPTFGQEWNDQISGDYGGQNMQDMLTAIDTVAAEPFVDENRLGAVGASYGGFAVYWLAGNHDKRFKAFISHCGIYNFESMYGSTEEYWFVNKDYEGPYWENPKPQSYNFSPHRFVQNWDTPILVISGGNDFRIPYTQSLEAFNSAQLLGIPSKLLLFPAETHFVLKPQNSVLWQREFFKWLDTYLK